MAAARQTWDCIVCELQKDWLWAIIQVQQSLMVASSDFSPFPSILALNSLEI